MKSRLARRPAAPVLAKHVAHVVRLRSEEQVIRVAARRVIAAVAHKHPVRDRSVMDNVTDPVNVVGLIAAYPHPRIPESARPLGSPITHPFPTCVRSAAGVQPRVEPFFQTGCARDEPPHREVQVLVAESPPIMGIAHGRCGGAVQIARRVGAVDSVGHGQSLLESGWLDASVFQHRGITRILRRVPGLTTRAASRQPRPGVVMMTVMRAFNTTSAVLVTGHGVVGAYEWGEVRKTDPVVAAALASGALIPEKALPEPKTTVEKPTTEPEA